MKDFIKAAIILVSIVLVFGAAMFGLNFITGPVIEANNAGAALAPLLAVMPEGATFGGDALITDTLTSLPASVTAVYKEANGLGYVIRTTASSQYSSAPMEITIGVTADGKICGIQIDSYNDTPNYDFRAKDPSYLDSYKGKDSALTDIGTVSGATYSSTAFKNAIAEAMGVLIANNMIAEGEKTPTQILTELLPTVAPGFTSAGILKCDELTASGNIATAYKAKNDTGFAFIFAEGETAYLAVVNAIGSVKVYDVESKDVTAEKTAIADEAKTFAAANQKDYVETLTNKIAKLAEGATEITPVTFDAFGNVVAAVQFKVGDATQYAFLSRPLTYEENAMEIYTVIDADGKIVKQDITQILFGHGIEYMPVYKNYGDSASSTYVDYENSFGGLTAGTLGDNVLISGATISSTAVKTATADAFNVFNAIKNGGTN